MIKETNQRLWITLSKKQIEWISETAKKLKLSKSKTIAWLLDKNIARITSLMMEELDTAEIVRISRINWLDK